MLLLLLLLARSAESPAKTLAYVPHNALRRKIGADMHRGSAWAALLFTTAFLLSGCVSNSNAYPNDQGRIVDVLSDKGLKAAVVSASEEMGGSLAGDSTSNPFEWGSFVTISYSTTKSTSEAERSALPIIRRVVWEQYPHRIETLTVEVYAQDSSHTYEYSRTELEAELGKQEFRGTDSELPELPFSDRLIGLIVALVFPAGLLTWCAILNRKVKRRGRNSNPAPAAPVPQPNTALSSPFLTKPPPPVHRPVPAVAPTRPRVHGIATTPPEPPHTTRPIASKVSEPSRPSTKWQSFEEIRLILIDSWEGLAERAPKPPRSARKDAAWVDKWLAKHSDIPAEDIATARRARNDATHKRDRINMDTMRRALKIIDKVNERLHQDS